MSKNKDNRSELREAEREQRTRQLLVQFGLWPRLAKTTLAPHLLHTRYPHVSIALAEGTPSTPSIRRIVPALEKAIRHAVLDMPILGENFSVTDYFAFVKPIMDVLRSAQSTNQSLADFIAEKRQETNELGEPDIAAAALLHLHKLCDDVLVMYGRIDHELYYLVPEFGRRPDNKWFLRYLLHVQPARRRYFHPPGEDRRLAYQCGQPFGRRIIDWVEWPSTLVGLPGPERQLPVFIQGHALDNLYRREARALFIKDGEWHVHDYLWQSLQNSPKLHKGDDPNTYLVEYWLNAHKLGYLVAEAMDDAILIRTFLFLTMNGTPEGNKLREKLGLTRRWKEKFELDRIQTFLLTDIQSDPELVSILSDCGCGHLFKILIEPPTDRMMTGYADQLRDYIARIKRDN